MPVQVGLNYTRRPYGGDPIHTEITRLTSGFLPASYFLRDDNGDRIVWQGLVLAMVAGGVAASSMTGSQNYYVPWSAAGSYGAGSDTAVGILREIHDATLSDWQVIAVDRGTAYERRCYCGGGPIGSIPASVKTDLTDIKWR